MDIYLCPLTGHDKDTVKRLTEALPPKRRERATTCRNENAALATVLGYHLVRHALVGVLDSAPLTDWETAKNGKPHISHSTAEFSLSHTDSLVAAVATKNGPVGLDIEKIRPLRAAFLSRYFSPEEQDVIARATSPEEAAILLWTAKEASVKRTGEGLRKIASVDTADTFSTLLTLQGLPPHALSLSPADTVTLHTVSAADLLKDI